MPDANAHLQATARDARGRKQYRYPAKWRALRDNSKFARMLELVQPCRSCASAWSTISAGPGLRREKILATVVHLLETTFIRVDNEECAKTNHSYGLTTLRNRHVSVNGSELEFELAAKAASSKELPNAKLFQYLHESGPRQSIGSHDVGFMELLSRLLH